MTRKVRFFEFDIWSTCVFWMLHRIVHCKSVLPSECLSTRMAWGRDRGNRSPSNLKPWCLDVQSECTCWDPHCLPLSIKTWSWMERLCVYVFQSNKCIKNMEQCTMHTSSSRCQILDPQMRNPSFLVWLSSVMLLLMCKVWLKSNQRVHTQKTCFLWMNCGLVDI